MNIPKIIITGSFLFLTVYSIENYYQDKWLHNQEIFGELISTVTPHNTTPIGSTVLNTEVVLASDNNETDINLDQLKQSIIKDEYNISWQEQNSRFESPNRENNLRFAYSESGFSVQPRTYDEKARPWNIEFKTKGIYRDNELVKYINETNNISNDESQLVFNYNNGLKIEYINTVQGMRQNFYLSEKPADEGILRCKLEIISSLNAQLVNDSTLLFGNDALVYNDLKVWDKNNQQLNAWFELSGDQINNYELAIMVDDRNAEYPIVIDPLSISANKILEADQAFARFGFSIADDGDINNDGYNDIVVGAPSFDNGNSDEGRVFIYHGSPSGFNSLPTSTIEFNISYMEFGNSVCFAGDVNNDGYDDVLIGAWKYNGGLSAEGSAYLYLGSAGGLSITFAWQSESDQANAYYGYKVTGLGDVNNDGFDDFAVSAYQYDNVQSSEGKVFAYYGESGIISPIADWSYEPNFTFTNLGYDISKAGDVNGDGYDDFIAGANNFSNGQSHEGKAYVFYGSPTGLSLTPSWTAEGNVAEGFFSSSVNEAGDVNGDGYDDILIGAYGQSFNFYASGKAYLYFGSATGLASIPSWSESGPMESAQFGFTCNSAGDLNNDGFSDICIGAPKVSNVWDEEGAVFVYLGSAGGIITIPEQIIYGQQTNARIGKTLCHAGDLNNDSFDDIIIGAHDYDNGSTDEGLAFIVYGQPDGVGAISSFTQINQADAGFGTQITELKSEGSYYLVVSAPYYDNGNINEGIVNVYGYSDFYDINSISFSIEGNQDNAKLGLAMVTTNDVNADGVPEVLISAPDYDGGQLNEGIVYLYDVQNEDLLWSYESDQINAQIGNSLAGGSDLNNDGYNDFIIGSENYDEAISNGGAMLIFYGDPVSLSTTPNLLVYGNQSNSGFAHSIEFAGDVNADGYEDIVCGAPYFDNGQTDEGRLYIYFGSNEGFDSMDPFIYENNQTGSNLGMEVCGTININNDLFSDIAVSATGFDNGELNEGIVYLYTGSSTTINLFDQLEINQEDAYFGNSISYLKDINEDGSDEIIIGVPFYDDGENDEGGVFIYLSAAGGIYDESTLTILTSNKEDFQYGEFIKNCISLDGDNTQEILIGSPHAEEGELNEGMASIYFTNNLIPASSGDFPVWSTNTIEYFGYNLLGGGDINGDGFKDLVIGYSVFDNGQTDEGKIMIFFGDANGIDNIVDQEVERNLTSFYFGGTMDLAGDVNNDGYDDLIFGKGSFSSPQTNEGVVELYLGGPSGLITPFYRQYQGNASSKYYGSEVKGCGDINGDGIDDFVSGCSGYTNGQSNEGAILVFFGNVVSMSLIPDQIIESNIGAKKLGTQISAGDVNGDGFNDIISTASVAIVELYYGSSVGLNTSPSWSVADTDNNDFNETIEISPDVNGDGYADIFISATSEEYEEYDSPEGAIYGFYGSATIPSTTEDWKVWSNTVGYSLEDSYETDFGFELEGETDFNGDGYFDLIVTVPRSDLDQINTCCESLDEGEIRIFFGSEYGLQEDYDIRLVGDKPDLQFGCALTKLGDINNDGFDDFMTGSDQLNTNNLYIIYGHLINEIEVIDTYLQIEQNNSGFGNEFDHAGDINGDGYSDFMVTAPYYDASFENVGKLYVYYGSAEGLKTQPDFTFTGMHVQVYYAKVAGDVNGDGYSDILLVTQELDGVSKQVNCYYGSPLGLNMDSFSIHFVDADYPTRLKITQGADFNNDGYGDVVIGNPYSNPISGGNIYIFMGSAAGLSETPIAIIPGDLTVNFGQTLAITDANADGFEDVIVGAPFNVVSQTPSLEPKVYLFKGNTTGIELTPSWIYTGPPYLRYAHEVENVGDINGDGYGDLMVHTSSEYLNNYQADIFYGSELGFSDLPDWNFNVLMIDSALTGPLASAGDFNNDGYSDIFAPSESEKKIYIYYGGKNGLSTEPDNFITSPTDIISQEYQVLYGNRSTKVLIAGDNNADGYLEYAITNNYETDDYYLDDYADQIIYFFNSRPSKDLSSPNLIDEINQANAQLGYSISDAGDVNGDGINDMIVGAPFYDNGHTDEGKIFVFYGSNEEVSATPDWSVEINKANANFGISVACAGDVNGDGYSDIIAGASKLSLGQSQEGGAYIYYGSSSGLTLTPTLIQSNQIKANLGISVSSAGDVNRDGYSDIIIGAEKYDNGLQDEGAVYVHYGSDAGINPLPNIILENNKKKSNFGHAIAQAGDVNGDGYSDIIVGADKLTAGQSQEGKVYVYRGSATGIITTPIWSYESNQVSANLGCSVSSAGDVNGDGFADVLAGAYNFDAGQTDEGAAFVFYGSAAGISPTANWTGESGKSGAGFGYSVSGAGDLNADGYSDIAIGAPYYDNDQINEGKIYVYFGSHMGLESNLGWMYESNISNKQIGFSINNSGDINADAYSDILSGGNLFSGPEISEGIAEIFYGNGLDNKRNNIVLLNADLVTPVSHTNISESNFGFNFFRHDVEGLGYSKAVWEIKTEGIPFSQSIFGTIENSIESTDEQTSFIFADDIDTFLFDLAAKEGDINKLRVRQKYDLVNSLDGRIYGPWRYYGSPTLLGPVPAPKNENDVKEESTELIMNIYPNPAQDYVYVEITGNQNLIGSFEIYVYNIDGALVNSRQFNYGGNNTLIEVDCSAIPAGNYIISYVSANNLITKKFIKL